MLYYAKSRGDWTNDPRHKDCVRNNDKKNTKQYGFCVTHSRHNMSTRELTVINNIIEVLITVDLKPCTVTSAYERPNGCVFDFYKLTNFDGQDKQLSSDTLPSRCQLGLQQLNGETRTMVAAH